MEEKVAAIIAALRERYPDALCALHYGKDYELMISVRLSAQCTDARVNQVTPALFARYPTLDAFAEADVAEVEEYVRSCGFFHHKAQDIVAACRMLNSIATQVTGFLTQSYLGTGDAYAHTEFIEQTARLAKLNSKYRCTTAIFIALAIWLILYFILKKTKFGYEIDCIGKQWEFADAVGMHVSRKIVVIFVVGGALAGIAGATEILGVNYNFVNTFSANPGIGWDGFFVCILAGSNPVGILLFSIVFGALRYGALAAQTGLGVPLDLINIIKSTLVLFMAIKLIGNNREAIADFFGHIFHRSAVKKEG